VTTAQGETAVTTSALICGGTYLYRKLSEGAKGARPAKPKVSAKEAAAGVVGLGEVLPVGTWITGAGVTFIALSIITSANSNLGGSLAILVATGAILANGQALIGDVQGGLQAPQLKQAAEVRGTTPSRKAAGPSAGNHPPTAVK
jgi:hypothetical protein